MFDPDAPTGSGFWHWSAANIPADTASLPKGAGSGDGIAGRRAAGAATTSARSAMAAPAPLQGKPHHYQITVFALDVDKLDVDQNASPAAIGFNLHGHTLAKTTLTGLYGR